MYKTIYFSHKMKSLSTTIISQPFSIERKRQVFVHYDMPEVTDVSHYKKQDFANSNKQNPNWSLQK